jgi:hypothetical protein
MDARLETILTRQQAAGFPGLSGSSVRATIRVSAVLLNEAVAAYAASASAVRDLSVTPRADNRLHVQLKLAKASFLPSLSLMLVIERQPELPQDPVLVFHITGAGGMMRLAGPAISSFGVLPPGIRLEGDRLLVDLRAVLADRAQPNLLDYAEQLQVLTEEGSLVLLVQLRVP